MLFFSVVNFAPSPSPGTSKSKTTCTRRPGPVPTYSNEQLSLSEGMSSVKKWIAQERRQEGMRFTLLDHLALRRQTITKVPTPMPRPTKNKGHWKE